MGGWGHKLMLITPSGEALPCHAAKIIPGLQFANVKDQPLAEIWRSSDAFQKFRGESWMQAPCNTCDRRTIDFGGCRCQALLLAGDAAATDPVCSLSPNRPKIDTILAAINSTPENIAGVELAPPSRENPATKHIGAQHAAPHLGNQPSIDVRPEWLYRPNPS